MNLSDGLVRVLADHALADQTVHLPWTIKKIVDLLLLKCLSNLGLLNSNLHVLYTLTAHEHDEDFPGSFVRELELTNLTQSMNTTNWQDLISIVVTSFSPMLITVLTSLNFAVNVEAQNNLTQGVLTNWYDFLKIW